MFNIKNDFIDKKILNYSADNVVIKKIGGFLNSVYLLTYRDTSKKFIVKKYGSCIGIGCLRHLYPFLVVWILGRQKFSIVGKRRMEREYFVNTYLYNNNFPVPKIFSIDPKNKLILMEYIEGESFIDIIIDKIVNERKLFFNFNLIAEAGKKIAKAHRLNISIGDCKPRNIIVSEDLKIYFLDLEQSILNGDFAWDLAQFLYFFKHYLSKFLKEKEINLILNKFIKGYLKGGGNLKYLKKAASLKYIVTLKFLTIRCKERGW